MKNSGLYHSLRLFLQKKKKKKKKQSKLIFFKCKKDKVKRKPDPLREDGAREGSR